VQIGYKAAMAKAAEVHAPGHRIGGAGVQAVPDIFNLDQSFAPYFLDPAERRKTAVDRHNRPRNKTRLL
jgi:hypothetical protein